MLSPPRTLQCDDLFSTGCNVLWTNYTDMGASGAMKESGYNTADECLEGCLASVNCLAVDYVFSKSPQECWFHMGGIQERRSDAGVTHFMLDRCFTGIVYTLKNIILYHLICIQRER